MTHIASCIHGVPIFNVLSDANMKEVQSLVEHRHFNTGETVLLRDEPLPCLYVVARGRLKLSAINANGREQILRELGPGSFYGEMALFTDVKSEGDLIATEDSVVCLLESHALREVLAESPEVAWRIVQTLADRLIAAERTIADLALLDVGERLAAELLRLAKANGKNEDELRFELPVSWAQLAAKLGTTPESLSRRLKGLTKAGLVQVRGREVIIEDPQGLAEQVNR